ncbi:MAG: site-2 protease family protein, partial [Chloroflexi bacterium]|nr:site-2 protease family protein [Chloroflexota bacterium]
FRIGSIAGIDIFIHVSWFIILVFLTFSLATGWFPSLYPGYSSSTYLLLGLISTLLLFVSVLLHELAHSFVARARGLPVKNITLFIFGGVSNIEQEPHSAETEFLMAFVGPLLSLVIGGLCYGALFLLRGSHSVAQPILGYLAVTNILLGIFNLLPGFPLDGGRVLRSIVWKITGNAYRATQVATIVGQVIAYLFIFTGIWLFFFSHDPFDGIWFGFIGWFLLNAAQSARTQATLETAFRGVTVAQVMNPNPMTVPANISLQRLVDEYFLPQGLRSALVMQGDQLAGLITLSDIRHVPREQWPQTPVGLTMIPTQRLHTVAPQQSLREALPLMTGQDVNQLPVVQDGRPVGILTRDAIMRALEVRRSLGQDRGKRAA